MRVLERVRERVVGRFETQEGRKVVVPYDPKIDALVRIADGKAGGAREGEIVEVRLTAFPDARRVAYGEVEERLGFLGEPGRRRRDRPALAQPAPAVPAARRRRGRALSRAGPARGPPGTARLPRAPDRHDRRRDRQGLRRRHRGGEDAGGIPDRRPHRGRLPLRDRGRRPRRRGPFARAPPSTSPAASSRCCRSASRTGCARSNPRVDRLVLSAILDLDSERTGRRVRVREGSDPQRPSHDVHGGRPAARVGADGATTSAATGRTSPTSASWARSPPSCASAARRGARSTSTCPTPTSSWTTRGSSSASFRRRATSRTG